MNANDKNKNIQMMFFFEPFMSLNLKNPIRLLRPFPQKVNV